MVDNIDVTPGTGKTVAADEIAGVLFQRVKVGIGADGVAVDLAFGQGLKAASLPVTIASDDDLQVKLGSLTETAPATDTASSGMNGRLQRVAQRLTSLIGLFSPRAGVPFRMMSSTATTNAAILKVSAGTVRKVIGTSARATACYIKLYNKVALPAAGVDTPFLTIPIPAGSTFDLDFDQDFSLGIGMAITPTPVDTDIAGVAVGDIISLNILFA